MAGICFSIPLSIDPIHDKGCKARSRTLIVDNDFVLMKRFAPLWFRSLWQTVEFREREALLWLRDSKDPFFFCFLSWFGDFFFFFTNWMDQLFWGGRFNLWTIVSFRFILIRIGDREFFRGQMQKIVKKFVDPYSQREKTAFGFLGETDSYVVTL